MKEKVIRPDKTGGWERFGFVMQYYKIPDEDKYPYGLSKAVNRSDSAYAANQAIEKMIASAREKE